MEKFLEHIQEAEKIIRTIDHMTYITFPIVQDKRILFKIISETKKAIVSCINAILQYEYLYKRINLYKSQESNFRTFRENCAPRYSITKEEIQMILELFEILYEHKNSQMEFLKDKKIIILSENYKIKMITLEKVKEFLNLAKKILKKSKDFFMKNQ